MVCRRGRDCSVAGFVSRCIYARPTPLSLPRILYHNKAGPFTMSSNTESPSPTSSPSRPKPTRKATSRSATPPTFKATLNRRSSLAAPVAATTAEHTYFTPAEPTAAVFTAPVAVSDEPQPISNAPPTSLQFDPGVTFPAPEQISAPEQQPIPDQNNEDMSRERSDSGASTSRRGSLFGNLARPLRRSGSISDSGARFVHCSRVSVRPSD